MQNILENYLPTAIATLIEPMWILINRLLCMLQPLEELQDCNAKATKSIDMDYSSLPPQLVVFKALKSKHFVLASVCTMALLANLLAVAFSGLFNQQSFDIKHATSFRPPFSYKIVPINGSIGPSDKADFGSLEASGAYQGGNGEDQFLVAESNFTQNTPLPSWTDDSMFYLPLFAETTNTEANSSSFEATTRAVGAELDCTELQIGQSFQASITNTSRGLTEMSMNVTVPSETGNATCDATKGLTTGTRIFGPLGSVYECLTGPNSYEIVSMLQPRINATQEERDACSGRIILAWMRHAGGTCPMGKRITINDSKGLFVMCRPKMVTASATIHVDTNGRLLRPVQDLSNKSRIEHLADGLLSNDVANIAGQSNLYLFQATGGLHNDSFANDYLNYFIRRGSGSRLLDPSLPAPTFDEVMGPLNKAYSKLFAIWLGVNKKNLFVPASGGSLASVDGYRVEREPRVVLSRVMFLISEVILCTYVLVAVWLYARRPGQYLARMPTSIASLVALFAASTAVQDMKGTSHLDKKGRAKHLEQLGSRYGYGSFIGGSDGRVHIGIEKHPLVVKPRSKSTWLEQKIPLLRRRTSG